jgi:polyferredoxin
MKLFNATKKIILLMFCMVPIFIFSQSTEKAVEHAQRKAPTFFDFLTRTAFISKYYAMIILGIIVLALLLTKKMKPKIRITILLISTFLFGIVGNIPLKPFSFFSMHPSPMCVTKALLYGFRIPFMVTLGVILILSLVGPRLFCGYICPVGAVQELMSALADKLKIKRKSFNFTMANTIRLFIFVLFIFLSATAIVHVVFEGNAYPQSIYDYVNPFHGLEISMPTGVFDALTHYLPFLLTVILAFKFYRPFCHFVCPIGLFTHWTEQVSLFKISLNRPKCTDCQICVKKAPCEAMDDILKDSTLRPDCYTCYACIKDCPEDALEIGTKRTVKT